MLSCKVPWIVFRLDLALYKFILLFFFYYYYYVYTRSHGDQILEIGGESLVNVSLKDAWLILECLPPGPVMVVLLKRALQLVRHFCFQLFLFLHLFPTNAWNYTDIIEWGSSREVRIVSGLVCPLIWYKSLALEIGDSVSLVNREYRRIT